jgi:hypothetical protein
MRGSLPSFINRVKMLTRKVGAAVAILEMASTICMNISRTMIYSNGYAIKPMVILFTSLRILK